MAGGGGAWKVAYADFVTAMMAFFMVMWLTAQKPEVKESIASYFRDPFADQSGGAESDGPKRPRTPVNSDLPPSDARDQRPVTGRDTPDRLTPPPAIARRSSETPWLSIYFPLDTAVLSEEARQKLAGAAETLLGKPNRVELRAHTVRKPLPPGSPFESHWQLCYKRSELVMNELTQRGVEAYRFRLSQSEANEPATATLNERSVGENSRVDLYILNEFADPPAGVSGDRWDAENGVVLPGKQLDRKEPGDHGGEKTKGH